MHTNTNPNTTAPKTPKRESQPTVDRKITSKLKSPAKTLWRKQPFSPYRSARNNIGNASSSADNSMAGEAMDGDEGQQQQAYPPSLPAFLRQSRSDIATKFVDLEWQQRHRLASSLQKPSAASAASSSSPTTATDNTATDRSSLSARFARLPSSEEIAQRNRYVNVEPYASNRIRLRVAPGVSDYINASPIALGNRRYIATQGPKECSTSHFYRMLASETTSPAVIVMLTQTHEAGREKCFQYFPSSAEKPLNLSADPGVKDDLFQGTVTLVSSEEDAATRSTIRKLLVRVRGATAVQQDDHENGRYHSNGAQQQQQQGQEQTPATTGEQNNWQELEVYHCLFTGWPDFSVPGGENRDAMLELITLSARLNASVSSPPPSSSFHQQDAVAGAAAAAQHGPLPEPAPNMNPRIVHCSAGVGRSGTFIALDYLFGQLEVGALDQVAEDADPIVETVDVLRQQRMMMVQSDGQFAFLYDVLRDAWMKRWRSMQAGLA